MKDDTISRQAAIDAIKKCRNESDMPDMWYDGMSCALRCIYQLPSAQTERKEGKWLHKWSGDGSVWLEQNCSECGVTFEEEPNNYNFCPNCGADMREDDHG